MLKTIKGEKIPALGLGTFELKGKEGISAILSGLETGFRHIDTAIRYGNEKEVGEAIRQSGIKRSELFVTTKIWFTDLAPDAVARCVNESLERLGMDYVDLLLVHWPSKEFDLGDTLKAFKKAKDEGKTRLIGVSNFTTALLDEAINTHGADLFANQVEYHPLINQRRIYEKTVANGLLFTAYLPLARGKVFQEEVLQEIGAKYGKSAGQVSLRWLIEQENVAAIPRSSNPQNIRANFDIFDFELSDDDMARINALRGDNRYCDFDWAPEWDPLS